MAEGCQGLRSYPLPYHFPGGQPSSDRAAERELLARNTPEARRGSPQPRPVFALSPLTRTTTTAAAAH